VKENLGLINRVVSFSSVDGPGNRLVVFFQGCNFRCINCHNPQTMGVCKGINKCGKCISACKNDALTNQASNDPIFNKDKCQGCDYCIEVCPYFSDPRATPLSPQEIIDYFIKPASPFISGLTLSGGEATLYLNFIKELIELMNSDEKLNSLTIFIDSNGTLPLKLWYEMAPLVEGVMIDLKAFSPDLHKKITGVNNESVLASIYYLNQINKLWEVRLLILPGYTGNYDELNRIASFLSDNANGIRIRLIPFRNHGVRALYKGCLTEPKKDFIEDVFNFFKEKGFFVYIT